LLRNQNEVGEYEALDPLVEDEGVGVHDEVPGLGVDDILEDAVQTHQHLVLLLVLHGLVVPLVDPVVALDGLLQVFVVRVVLGSLLEVLLEDEVVLERPLEGFANEVLEGLYPGGFGKCLLDELDLGVVLPEQLQLLLGGLVVLEEVGVDEHELGVADHGGANKSEPAVPAHQQSLHVGVDLAREVDHAEHVGEHLPLLVLTDEVAELEGLLDLLADQLQVFQVFGLGLDQFAQAVVAVLGFAGLLGPLLEAGGGGYYEAEGWGGVAGLVLGLHWVW